MRLIRKRICVQNIKEEEGGNEGGGGGEEIQICRSPTVPVKFYEKKEDGEGNKR